MPLNPDIGDKDYETFKQEFAEKIIEMFARYAPNMTRKNIIGQHVYTGREYVARIPADARRRHLHGRVQRRAGDVQPLRLPHADRRLYMAGSAAHPGGAISGGSGYISAGIIARDLGLKLVVEAVGCARGAEQGRVARKAKGRHRGDAGLLALDLTQVQTR